MMDRAAQRRDLDAKIGKILEKLTITRSSFEKMNTYARIASGLAGRHIECGGLLVGEHREGLPLVTEVILLEGLVTDASGNFDYDCMNEAYLRARDEGKVIMGMWHSHGAFGVFHSTHDDAHLDIILDRNTRLLPNLLLREEKESKIDRSLVETKETSITIKEQSGEKATTIRFKDANHDAVQQALSSIEGVYTQEIRGIPFAASIVINKKSYDDEAHVKDPVLGESVYVEAVSKHPTRSNQTLNYRGIGIEIFPDESSLDEMRLYEEVGRKVMHSEEKLEHRLRCEEKNTAAQERDKTQTEMLEEKREQDEALDEIAKRYDHIVHSDTYVKAMKTKIMHRYRMLQTRRLFEKLGPEPVTKVYDAYMKRQGKEYGQDQKAT